jgi:transcriptional regulator with XRE-family HTH domain
MYQVQISILLKEIRGNETQLELSKRLNFKFNQYSKWESGTTEIDLIDFFRLCDLKNVEIDNHLYNHLHIKCDKYDSGLLGLLYLHWNSYSEEKFLKLTGFSRSKWWRLKNNKSDMTLNDFLIFIEKLAGKKDSFLALLSKDLKKKEYLQENKNELQFITALKKNVEFAAIYSSFFLREYLLAKNIEERKSVLIKSTGIESLKLDIILKELIDDKLLNAELNDVGDLFKVNFSLAQSEVSDLFSEFCLKHTLSQLKLGRDNKLIIASPILAAVSDEAISKIREILTYAQSEMAKVIASDDNMKKERLAYIYLGLVD